MKIIDFYYSIGSRYSYLASTQIKSLEQKFNCQVVKNKVVSYISQWYPSSKTCSVCDYILDELPLDTRYWCCPSCSTKHGRDANASVNILRVGASTLRVGDISQPKVAISA